MAIRWSPSKTHSIYRWISNSVTFRKKTSFLNLVLVLGKTCVALHFERCTPNGTEFVNEALPATLVGYDFLPCILCRQFRLVSVIFLHFLEVINVLNILINVMNGKKIVATVEKVYVVSAVNSVTFSCNVHYLICYFYFVYGDAFGDA